MVMGFSLAWNPFTNNNQAKELPTDNHIPFREVSESSYSQTINKNLQISIDSKSTKRIVSKSNKTPLTADFPLGWFVSINNTNTLTKVANEGINVVMPYVGKSDDAKIMSYLDAAEKAEMKVLLELPRSIIKAEDTDAIIKFVRKFKNHPAVFAWYSWDEPEIQGLSPTTLKKVYEAIKAEDTSKPVAVVFTRLWGIEKYLDSLDIFMWDYYPVTDGSPEFGSPDWRKMKSWFKKAASHSQGKDGFWFVLQGYGEKSDGTPQFGKRLPTFREERYMLYNAVLSGINGLFLWAHYRSQQSWIDSVLTPIVEEFHDYIPAIREGKIVDQAKANYPAIEVSLYKYPGSRKYYLIAINHGKQKLEAKIRLKQSTRTKFARVIEENRYVRLTCRNRQKTIFEDTFDPYTVHIYEIL